MKTAEPHAKLYEVRVPVTPELAYNSSIDMTSYVEDKARRSLLDDLGPDLAARAKLWWEIEPQTVLCTMCHRPRSPVHDVDAPGLTTRHPFVPEPRRRWDPQQSRMFYPKNIRLLMCVVQVVDWYDRNPLIYGFMDRTHDWPDFRCQYCTGGGGGHVPPNYYCPICGDIFWEQCFCGHTLEEGGPAPAITKLIPQVPHD